MLPHGAVCAERPSPGKPGLPVPYESVKLSLSHLPGIQNAFCSVDGDGPRCLDRDALGGAHVSSLTDAAHPHTARSVLDPAPAP